MEPTFRVNLLPKRSLKQKAFWAASLVIILTSLALLAYPFLGEVQYELIKIKGEEAAPIPAENKLLFLPGELTGVDEPQLDDLAGPVAELAKNEPMPTVSAPAVTVKGVARDQAIAAAVKKQNEAVNAGRKEVVQAALSPPVVSKTTAVNKIIISKIGVDMKIVEGSSESALYQGAWRLPGTSRPNLGGNTVISAHRYLYRPPSKRTFYNLDKLEIGDKFKILWQGEEYQYQVKEIKIVEPGQVEILNQTRESIVTLFTCTPLFTSEKRLVVIGSLI